MVVCENCEGDEAVALAVKQGDTPINTCIECIDRFGMTIVRLRNKFMPRNAYRRMAG